MQTNKRVERFKAEAADLNLKAGNASQDSQLQMLGVILMVTGIVVGLLSYQGSLGSSDTRDILSYVSLAVAGVSVTIAGAAVYLRYALGKFLRVFLLRQLYEGQANLDQVVEAIRRKQHPTLSLEREGVHVFIHQPRGTAGHREGRDRYDDPRNRAAGMLTPPAVVRMARLRPIQVRQSPRLTRQEDSIPTLRLRLGHAAA